MALYANGYKVAPIVLGTYEFSNLSGSPYDNIALANALNGKATSAQGAKADTAIQPNDNVSRLTNDAGYLTLSTLPIYDGDVV